MICETPILLVEDDRIDIKNVRRAFADNKILNPLHIVGNGEEALAFLMREGAYTDHAKSPRPGLIILDLNLPKLSGLEFLRAYKDIPSLRAIPSVILTTSQEESDRISTYEIGIAGYIVKPIDFSKFVEAIKRFDLYWSLCELPT